MNRVADYVTHEEFVQMIADKMGWSYDFAFENVTLFIRALSNKVNKMEMPSWKISHLGHIYLKVNKYNKYIHKKMQLSSLKHLSDESRFSLWEQGYNFWNLALPKLEEKHYLHRIHDKTTILREQLRNRMPEASFATIADLQNRHYEKYQKNN